MADPYLEALSKKTSIAILSGPSSTIKDFPAIEARLFRHDFKAILAPGSARIVVAIYLGGIYGSPVPEANLHDVLRDSIWSVYAYFPKGGYLNPDLRISTTGEFLCRFDLSLPRTRWTLQERAKALLGASADKFPPLVRPLLPPAKLPALPAVIPTTFDPAVDADVPTPGLPRDMIPEEWFRAYQLRKAAFYHRRMMTLKKETAGNVWEYFGGALRPRAPLEGLW